MSEEKKGIIETKEILQAVNGLTIDIIKGVKDGISVEDIAILLPHIAKIKDAVEGAGEVPDELKDLDQAELIELSAILIAMVYNIINSLKAE